LAVGIAVVLTQFEVGLTIEKRENQLVKAGMALENSHL